MNPKKLLFLFIITIALVILFFSVKPFSLINFNKNIKPSPFPTPIPTKKDEKTSLKWGVFAGSGVNDFIDVHQKLGGRQADLLPLFIHWGNNNQLPHQFTEYAALENQTLVIYWEAMNYNHPKPVEDNRYSYDQILKGTYDKYITQFAQSLKDFGRPVILIPFEEMNGDWYPWSVTKNGNTPEKHIAAYRYLRKFFKNAPNVKFAWSINNESIPNTPENQPQNYYPGNAYVDYVGVDGFNFGSPWQSFDQVFSKSLTELQKFNKPVYIFSMASAPGPQKNEWIKEAATLISKTSKLNGWIWFNENKERDWRIWSDNESLKSFQLNLLTDSK